MMPSTYILSPPNYISTAPSQKLIIIIIMGNNGSPFCNIQISQVCTLDGEMMMYRFLSFQFYTVFDFTNIEPDHLVIRSWSDAFWYSTIRSHLTVTLLSKILFSRISQHIWSTSDDQRIRLIGINIIKWACLTMNGSMIIFFAGSFHIPKSLLEIPICGGKIKNNCTLWMYVHHTWLFFFVAHHHHHITGF